MVMLVKCSIEDCEKSAHARGWCQTHYSRWRIHGSPTGGVAHEMHGLRATGAYHSSQRMRERCMNPNFVKYHRYGGRGITVCERWSVFSNFLEDMGERPAGMTLDRIDPDGNYEPGNCRWATNETQQANRAHKAMPIEEKRRRDREYNKKKYWQDPEKERARKRKVAT